VAPALATVVGLSLRWALVLGAVGFAAGFFGPMVLNPEANIGPIVGILFTGPGGAIAGAILGALFGVLPLSQARRQQALGVACAVLAVGTLVYCLPEPAVRGYVIDAQVEACAPPTQALDAAVVQWEEAVARVTWAAPAANWKETAINNVQRDPGVVLTLRIQRKSAILRHRQPWDRARTSAGPWIAVDESKQYYADDEGSACEPYLARQRQIYWPAIDPDSDPTKPAKIWPPTDTLGFLQLQTLGPVPAEYQRLLR
jgi:hypothetical protein